MLPVKLKKNKIITIKAEQSAFLFERGDFIIPRLVFFDPSNSDVRRHDCHPKIREWLLSGYEGKLYPEGVDGLASCLRSKNSNAPNLQSRSKPFGLSLVLNYLPSSIIAISIDLAKKLIFQNFSPLRKSFSNLVPESVGSRWFLINSQSFTQKEFLYLLNQGIIHNQPIGIQIGFETLTFESSLISYRKNYYFFGWIEHCDPDIIITKFSNWLPEEFDLKICNGNLCPVSFFIKV